MGASTRARRREGARGILARVAPHRRHRRGHPRARRRRPSERPCPWSREGWARARSDPATRAERGDAAEDAMTRRDGVVRLEGAVRVDARVRACARASRVPSRRRRRVTKPVEEMRETTRRPRGGMARETRLLQKHHISRLFSCVNAQNSIQLHVSAVFNFRAQKNQHPSGGWVRNSSASPWRVVI